MESIKVVLDGVFHHVSRDFFAYKIQQQQIRFDVKNGFGEWIFKQHSPYHDPFSYQGWHGHLIGQA